MKALIAYESVLDLMEEVRKANQLLNAKCESETAKALKKTVFGQTRIEPFPISLKTLIQGIPPEPKKVRDSYDSSKPFFRFHCTKASETAKPLITALMCIPMGEKELLVVGEDFYSKIELEWSIEKHIADLQRTGVIVTDLWPRTSLTQQAIVYRGARNIQDVSNKGSVLDSNYSTKKAVQQVAEALRGKDHMMDALTYAQMTSTQEEEDKRAFFQDQRYTGCPLAMMAPYGKKDSPKPSNGEDTMITENTTKTVTNEATSVVKNAVVMAAGQAALATVRAFVINAIPKKMGLLAKLTGKKAAAHRFLNSPIGGFVLTAAVHTFFTVVSPKQTKLLKVTRMALDAATLELVTKVPYQKIADSLADQLLNNSVVANALDEVQEKND